jgi:hypothetical protein
MPFKLGIKDPKSLALSSVSGLAAWKASNFALDPVHLSMVITAATAGLAQPVYPQNRPDVSPDSHIQTPYVSNLEPKENG